MSALEPGTRLYDLEIVGRIGTSARYLVRCVCGRETVVYGSQLTSGYKKSCGCRHKRVITKHGHNRRVSGVNRPTKEYKAWIDMRSRCNRPNHKYYSYYGGRGVKVCGRWDESFTAFLEDIGPAPSRKHTLERINNNGNYEPGNCRWATWTEQHHNTRHTKLTTDSARKIRELVADGVTKKAVAEKYGVDSKTVRDIINGRTWKEAA